MRDWLATFTTRPLRWCLAPAPRIRQLLHELAGIGTGRAAAHIQHRTVRLLEQLRSVGKHTAVSLRGGVVAGQNHALRP